MHISMYECMCEHMHVQDDDFKSHLFCAWEHLGAGKFR